MPTKDNLFFQSSEEQKEPSEDFNNFDSLQPNEDSSAAAAMHSCITLPPESVAEFNRQFRKQALDRKKVSMRFEPSRLGASYSQGVWEFFSQLKKEVTGNLPEFGGENHFTKILMIKKLSNSVLEEGYTRTIEGIPASFLSSSLEQELQTIQLEEVQLRPGEVLLYHGTSSETSSLIMQHGFDENYCKYVKGNGYGPLGKGIYFTSELSKAATFSNCSKCGKTEQCCCVEKGSYQPADRVLLLSRVFIGRPEIILKKGDLKERTEPADSFDSCLALSREFEPLSEFRSTEVCVPKGSQVLPLYEIHFSSQPNLLQVSEWKKTLEQSGLLRREREMDEVADLLEISLSFLNELQEYRTSCAPFEIIQHQANKIGALIDTISRRIRDKYHIIQATIPEGQIQEMELERLDLQLRDLSLLKGQLVVFQEQSVDLCQKQKSQDLSLTRQSKESATVFPKEYSIKNECEALAQEIKNSPLSPIEFLVKLKEWLYMAIERDQRKGTTLHWIIGRTYPTHRIFITQKMISLRETLLELQKQEKSEEEIEERVQTLLITTLSELEDHAKIEPKILSATNYITLLEYKAMFCEHKKSAVMG